MNRFRREKAQITRLVFLFIVGVVFIVIFINSAINNSRIQASLDTSSLFKENPLIQVDNNKEEVVKNDSFQKDVNNEKIDTLNDFTLKYDIFYEKIKEKIKSEEKLPKINVSENYYPKNNYLKNAVNTNGKIYYYKNMPIRVFIPNSDYNHAITQAFIYYNNQFNGLLSFALAKDKADADIIVELSEEISNNKLNSTALSSTELVLGEKYIDSANIFIYLNKIELVDAESPLVVVYNLMLHEIGHAIGINGHSSNYKNDIMYPICSFDDLAKFSDRDIETIKLLYSGNETLILSQIQNFKHEKINELKKNIELTNNYDEILQLEKLYCDESRYYDAKYYFEKALSLDPTNYENYINFAICQLKQKKYSDAENLLNTAFKFAKSDEQKATIYTNLSFLYNEINDYNNALSYSLNALTLCPENKSNFINYIVLCNSLNKIENAKSAYDKYFELYEEDAFSQDDVKFIEWVKSL